MAYHHEAWAVVNSANNKKVVTIDGQFYIFTSEIKAWEECIKLRNKNPDLEFTVKKTRIPLPWKTYE